MTLDALVAVLADDQQRTAPEARALLAWIANQWAVPLDQLPAVVER